MTFRQILILPLTAAVGLAMVAGAPATADQTVNAIKDAQRLYRQGKLGNAYAKIEDAAAAIARRQSDRYAKTFPAAPDGWRADAVRSTADTKAQLGRGMQLSRSYTQIGGKAKATAMLIVDNQGLVAAMVKRLQDSATNKRRGVQPIAIAGVGTAYLDYSERFRMATISILVGKKFYVTIRVNNVDNPEIAKTMVMAWNFAALKKAGGVQ